MKPITKKQQLTEQLALEKAVRLGLIGCMINLVAQHARVTGPDDPVKALSDIKAALQKTASTLKADARDEAGGQVEISDFIQRNVSKMLDRIFVDAQKQLSKTVH